MTDPAKPPDAPEAPDEDVVLLHSPTEDGEGARVIRARQGRLEVGEVRPLKEGKAITGGEVVSLTPRADAPRVCDVKVQVRVPSPVGETKSLPHKGPARVTSGAYREGWDALFGARPPRGPAN